MHQNHTIKKTDNQPPDEDCEISILDILVVFAENIRIIILVPLLTGLIALGVTYLITPTYQSVAILKASEGAQVGVMQGAQVGVMQQGVQDGPEIFTSIDVINQVLKTYPGTTARELSKRIFVSVKKQDFNSYITLIAEDSTPQKAQNLCYEIIASSRELSLPRGKQLDKIKNEIKNTEEAISDLRLVANKISPYVDKKASSIEGEGVARAYCAIIEKLSIQKQLQVNLNQLMSGFGEDSFIQKPTLPDKAISPKKGKIAIMTAFASGFLIIIYIFIRAGLRNLSRDAEASEKLQRIRKRISLL